MPPVTRRDFPALLLLLVWGLCWHVPHLGHEWMTSWDEVLHQTATRGTYASFLAPHIYVDPLHTVVPGEFWASGVWLHKPPGPFWFGALMMHVTGVAPLALRLGSLLGILGAAAGIYLLARGAAGRVLALVCAAGFLVLPLTWVFTQGLLFGDVTDTTLTGWVTLAVVLLCLGVERQSVGLLAAAGAAVGVGFLCKLALALAPLGVAGVLWGLARLGWCRGPSTRGLGAMVAAAVLVAAPWSLLAARTWPEQYGATLRFNFGGHLSDADAVEVGPWRAPWDGTLANMVPQQLSPLPVAVGLLVLGALCVRAVRRREHVTVALALWLGATWFMHSVASVKTPGLSWNALPAVFAGLALVLRECVRTLPLALATLAAFSTGWLMEAFPALMHLRAALPAARFPLTRTHAGLAEGVVLTTAGALLGLLLVRLVRRLWPGPRVEGSVTSAAGVLAWGMAGVWLLWLVPGALVARREKELPRLNISYSADVGRVLDRQLPERSVLFVDLDRELQDSFEAHNAMFWSGRMAYRSSPDVQRAVSRGYHPYLLSPAAEAYAPVEGVPANAWLRAYDLLAPAPVPPLPRGVAPLSVQAGAVEVIGWAAGPAGGGRERWAFYVRPKSGTVGPLQVVFHRKGEPEGNPSESGLAAAPATPAPGASPGDEAHVVPPGDSLRAPARLAGAAWYVVPVVGPPRRQVQALGFGPEGVRVPLLSP